MTDLFGPVHWFTRGRTRVAYRTLGEGPPLFLIHGWPFHTATWRHLAPRLAAAHRLVMVDLPGLGSSEFDETTDFRFEGHAATLKALTDEVFAGPFGCLAHDTGATIARLLAAQTPTLTRLMLLNTEMPNHRPPWIRSYQALFAVPGGGAMFAAFARRRSLLRTPMGFGGCFADRRLLNDEFLELYVHPVLEDLERREGLMRYLRGIDFRTVDAMVPLHGRLGCQVRLVWGAEDPTFPLPLARAMCAQFPSGTKLTAIPNSRLLVHEEQPDAVAREALDFFTAAAA